MHVPRAKHSFHFWIYDIRRIYLVTFPVILSIRHWKWKRENIGKTQKDSAVTGFNRIRASANINPNGGVVFFS